MYMVPVVKCTRWLHCDTREGERERQRQRQRKRGREREMEGEGEGGREGEGDMQMFTNSEWQVSHHVLFIHGTYSKIHERWLLIHCGTREREKGREQEKLREEGGMQMPTNSESQVSHHVREREWNSENGATPVTVLFYLFYVSCHNLRAKLAINSRV